LPSKLLLINHDPIFYKGQARQVVVQFRQNLSGQPYVVARPEGRHPSTDSGQAPACPYIDAALKSN
jgi:hypothetical protein